jgi:uncharacterized protein YgfB (UPF0149 family)
MTSTLIDTPDYAALADLLKRAGYSESAANLHGSLCGALCVMETAQLSAESLVDEGAERAEPLDPADRDAVTRLRDAAAADLISTDMTFEPLLPSDTSPLAERVDALAAWCGGFLYGISGNRKLNLKSLSEEARETLRDFTQFTQAGFDASGEPEAEERAYTELVEYVRVGAQLLFLELRPRPPAPIDESSTVH